MATKMGRVRRQPMNQRLRVLVVDNDAATVRMMRLLLESEGFLVEGAPSREGALVQLAEQQPDVVIMDYMMGGMAPDAFIDAARASGLTAPILLCTGMQGDLGLEVDDVVLKPFNIDDLADRIRALATRT